MPDDRRHRLPGDTFFHRQSAGTPKRLADPVHPAFARGSTRGLHAVERKESGGPKALRFSALHAGYFRPFCTISISARTF